MPSAPSSIGQIHMVRRPSCWLARTGEQSWSCSVLLLKGFGFLTASFRSQFVVTRPELVERHYKTRLGRRTLNCLAIYLVSQA